MTERPRQATPGANRRPIQLRENVSFVQYWGRGLDGRQGETVRVVDCGEQIIQVVAGEAHALLRSAKGGVFVLGSNDFCQLGVDKKSLAVADSPTNLYLPENISISRIFSGPDYVFALGTRQELLGWGMNLKGQLGLGREGGFMAKPSHVIGLSGVRRGQDEGILRSGESLTDIACGPLHAVALTDRGRVLVCGSNETGALGFESAQGRWTFGELDWPEGAGRVEQIRVGVGHSGALVGGEVYVWGRAGQMGGLQFRRPTRLTCELRVHDFVMGDMLTILLTICGKVLSLGDNTDCQLGRPGQGSSVPSVVELPAQIESIACGLNHSIAISRKLVFGWGSNRVGQLTPDSDDKFVERPRPLDGLSNSDTSDVICGPLQTYVISRKPLDFSKPLRDNQRAISQVRELDRQLDYSRKFIAELRATHQELRQRLAEVYSSLKAAKNSEDELQRIKNDLKISRALDSGFEIEYHSIRLLNKVSEGSFGKIYRGTWRELEVAVKTLRKEFLKEENIVDFLS